MNYKGSYKKLLGNAKAAIMAAIEIYNKPAFKYRDECVVILLINAWELILKALLSKNGQSIYYIKKRHESYRTLSLQSAFGKAETFFPKSIQALPVRRNLELLGTFRDNAVHFYNADGFGLLIYVLSQTCIKNFRDLLYDEFDVRLEDEINWQMMPLGIKSPIDVISYISPKGSLKEKQGKAVRQFLSELARATEEVKSSGKDTGRLLTVFNVKLESVKKIGDADVVVGVEKAEEATGPLAIVKTQDPNITHPLRQKDIVGTKEKAGLIGNLHGITFSAAYVFQALVWKYGLKKKQEYCWEAREGVLTKYSYDIVAWIKKLTKADIEGAIKDYRAHISDPRRRN
jgi:Domain of unknown function (DUF3644)/EC042_2821-like Restriction Endonuclease-like domain